MKIGIYGGTFDPPHKGHTAAAEVAVGQLGLDRLFVIPAALPPHKEISVVAPDAEIRLEMTKIAMSDVPKAEVSDMEILRGGRSYTVDTVAQIREKYPDAELYLLVGTDMAMSLKNWKDAPKIMAETVIAAVSRKGGDDREIAEHLRMLEQSFGAKTAIVTHEPVEVSSSEMRELLPARRGNEYLRDGVYSYVIKNRIYGAKPSLDWLREKSYSMLKPTRIPHVAGCEQMAVRLAEKWGADADSAAEAAILHDITKKESLERQLILCEKYGIIIDTVERESVNLLHSKTAAAVAKNEFGCDGDIVNAVMWHTTGRENMSLLEKIVYMADMIEPNRDYPGVEELRDMALTDLDRALEMCFVRTVEHVKNSGIKPHERTVRALMWIREILEARENEAFRKQ